MTPEVLARFEPKVRSTDGCWEWTACRSSTGYGLLNVAGRPEYAHRLAFEHYSGPIPAGLHIDHLCRNRACVNPAHLEAVTSAENTRRGAPATKTRCVRGHQYDERNTGRDRRHGRRYCRACHRQFVARRKARLREETSHANR